MLNPFIALTIADFSLFPEQPDLISQYKLLEKQRLTEYSDDIELIFIELPKFTKAEHELRSIQDKWLYFIKNAGSLEFVPKNSNKEIEKAYQIANEANFSEEELELQHRKRDWVYIQKSSIELASKAGREEGLQEGLEKGIKQGMEKGVEQGRDEVTQKIVLNLTKENINGVKSCLLPFPLRKNKTPHLFNFTTLPITFLIPVLRKLHTDYLILCSRQYV